MVRFAPTDMPLTTSKSSLRYPFDPSVGPGYVWHCHIVEHEDNDMMRPLNVLPNPSENLTSGTYFYQLKAGPNVATKKLVVKK